MKGSCMSRYLGVFLLFIAAGSLSSCNLFHKRVAGKKARQHSADTTAVVAPPDTTRLAIADTVAKPDTSASTNELITMLTPLWNRRITYKTFSGKAKMNFEGPDGDQEFTAHFRIRKDSIIWVAITGLGGVVQVARIYVTPDSFILVNQLQKEVTRLPLDSAAKVLPAKVDFAALQRLIVGEPLRDGNITGAFESGGGWVAQVEDAEYLQHITYNKADSTMRSGQMRTRKEGGPQAMIQYGGYEMVTGRKLSTNRVLNIQNGAEMYMLDMNFQRTDFDQQLEYPINIPSSYKRKDFKKGE